MKHTYLAAGLTVFIVVAMNANAFVTVYPATDDIGVHNPNPGPNTLGIVGDTFHGRLPNDIKVGIGYTLPTYKLDVNGEVRLTPMAAAPAAANGVMYYDSGLGQFRCHQGGVWVACTGSGGNGWTDIGPVVHLTTGTDDVGIGTAAPASKLHVNDALTASGSAAQVSFSNAAGSIGATGLTVTGAAPTDKGTQVAVSGTSASTGAVSGQAGTARGDLAVTHNFHFSGAVLGVDGQATVTSLSNFDGTATSLGLGGRFVGNVDTPIVGPATGTYWVGGAYGEVTGNADQTPTNGVQAGIIGRDTTTGAGRTYAGFFQGDVSVDASGYLQAQRISAGAPPAADCTAAFAGRMAISSVAPWFYVCVGGLWRAV